MDASDPPAGGQVGAERKLVTVVVCEVVEPTAAAGQGDLEDRDQLLGGALTAVQAEVARHGGLVAEVIGDVVVAVFGVPRTRDDDAERAVLAALAARARLATSSLGNWRVRTAVATGEALVRLGEPAGAGGRGISGEVVAAAMAVKDAAPHGTVLVTAATLQATQRAVSYAPARLLRLTGASEPVPVWDALAPRPRSGRAPPLVLGAELVGRDGELAVLLDRYQRIRTGGGPQLVTLVGSAGIGKSRLLAELGRRVVGESAPPAWRTGRAQPTVDGGTFGALVEIAKAEAGILDGDPVGTAKRKLADAIAQVLEGPTAGWVTRQLRPLVGASAGAAAASGRGVERGADVEAAWRWLLRGLAGRQPLVLAVEDLHWADQLLLDVLDSVVDPALVGSIPLLVVVTCRPELLDRRPGWDRQHPNRTTVRLGPLPIVDTTRLLHALLAHHKVAAAIQPDLLARVGGNPLFAEEYARLLRDRHGRAGSLPVPATVHGVIAARLDALAPEDKAVLANAAVLGLVGWVGGIAAVGGHDPADLDGWLELNRRLGELERRELLRWVAGSRVAGEVEVAFRHVLVRDVAYAQLPRAVRADRHRRAAAWLEQLAPDRTSDRAELLAYHYTQALTYAQAAGQPTGELVDRARFALREAGDHATALGTEVTAARYYTQALELWPEEDPEQPGLELRAGRARCFGEGAGEELLIRARDGLLAAGARERAAEAEALLGRLAYVHGRPRSVHIERALALVADAPPSRSKLAVLNGSMLHLMVADRHTEALGVAHQALVMAGMLGARDVEAVALGIIGAARINQGDPGGLADVERCVALIEEVGSSNVIGWHHNLAYARLILGDLRGSFAATQAALHAAERYGAAHDLRWIERARMAEHYWTGRWDQALQIAETVVADAAGGTREYLECECRIWRGRIRLAKGEVDAALQDATRALELARESGDAQNLDPALGFAARALLTAGRVTEAGELLEELLTSLADRALNPHLGVDLAVDLAKLGHPASELDAVPPSPWQEAARAFVAGHPARAAALYAEIGSRPDEAYARLQAARSLIAGGHAAEANAELAIARTFYREVGANAYLAVAEA
jgi:class 3 adenylate cyclase/tetratricopeptide (TPR) repeat protein